MERIIKRGFKESKSITRKYAKSFYFSSYFLPNKKRMAAYSVYAICRISDESVDSPGVLSPSLGLKKLKKDIESVYGEAIMLSPLLSSFRDTVNEYRIPKEYFLNLMEGMQMDLDKKRYQNFCELYDYCYKAAGVVGLIMLKIFGYQDIRAEKYAVDLGIAMQLTNILRDIKEDYARGRIYLPLDDMQRYKVGETDISEAKLSADFINLMKFQASRAREYYNEAGKGMSLISDTRCRLTAKAMKEIYAKILDEIKNNRYDVFSTRAHVKTMDKIMLILNILLERRSREN
jgi:phytoene synthase